MFSSSIRKRMIVLLLLITVIPIGGSIMLTYMLTIDSLKSKTIEDNAKLLFQGKTTIENYMDGLNRLTLSIYKNSDSTKWFKSGIAEYDYSGITNLREFLSAMFHFNDDIEQVFLYLSNNQQAFSVSSRYVFNAKQLDYQEQSVIEKMKQNPHHTYLQGPHILNFHGLEFGGDFERKQVFTLYRMLINPNNETQGFLAIDFETDSMDTLSQNIYNPKEEEFYLVDREGHLFSPYEHNGNEEILSDEWFHELKQQETGQGHLFWKTELFHGVIIYESLPESLGGLFLIKKIPFDILYKEAQDIVKINIAIGVIVLILVIIATFFVSFKITSPIKVLMRNIQRIETGHMAIDFKSLGNDEIGILGDRFKSMIATIDNLIIKEYRLEIENKTNQLKALLSQMNPHFINNALQSIGALAVEKGAPEVYRLIRSLSRIMQYSMDTREDQVTLSMEIDHVVEYLKLQKERFEERLSVQWSIEEEALNCRVPKMTLQPLVENYFKHGFEQKQKNGHLVIRAEIIDTDTLRIVVQDNGSGIAPDRLRDIREQLENHELKTEQDGIGLVNIYSRLFLYYGNKVEMNLKNLKNGGLMVEIRLPVLTKVISDAKGGDSS